MARNSNSINFRSTINFEGKNYFNPILAFAQSRLETKNLDMLTFILKISALTLFYLGELNDDLELSFKAFAAKPRVC